MVLCEDEQNGQTVSQIDQGKKGRRLKSIKLEMKKEKSYIRQHRNTKDHKRLLWATICK